MIERLLIVDLMISSSWGTAVNVQEMVYGNRGDTSGTGVAFTRNPATGENRLFGEYLMNAQGEDVVAGIRTPQSIDTLKEVMPECYEEFSRICKILEEHYKICKIWSLLLKMVSYSCFKLEMVNVRLLLL